MRPKSPFLQNLRKKTPAPQMKKSSDETTSAQLVSAPEGFKPFQWEDGAAKSSISGFTDFQLDPDPVVEQKAPEVPQLDVEAEKRKAFDQGYAKAKAEFMRYKTEAERLEKGFQEILGAVQESRIQWVQEIREGVAQSMQTAFHHIAQHPKLQTAILAHKLSEAMTQLSEEKDLTVFVDAQNVAFAQSYLADKSGWSVVASENVGSGAILESVNGVWDARMQVTLSEIDDLLAAWMVDMESDG